eukprot:5701675-Pleurochrysis_carterae.AAC.2
MKGKSRIEHTAVNTAPQDTPCKVRRKSTYATVPAFMNAHAQQQLKSQQFSYMYSRMLAW